MRTYPAPTGITHYCPTCGAAWLCEAARHGRECIVENAVVCSDCKGVAT